MSSLKMTFSLTSLILIIALGLVFVPTSVMAHDDTGSAGGLAGHVHPMVTISSANGNDATGTIGLEFTDADTTDTAVFPTTAMFELMVEFDVTVTGASAGLVPTLRFFDADGTLIPNDSSNINSGTLPALDDDADATTTTLADGKIFKTTVTLTDARDPDADGFKALAIIEVTVPAGATGSEQLDTTPTTPVARDTFGVASELTEALFRVASKVDPPPPHTVAIEPDADASLGAAFEVTFTFTPAVSAFASTDIIVTDGSVTDGPTQDDDDDTMWTATISPVLDATEIMISVNSSVAGPAAEMGTATVDASSGVTGEMLEAGDYIVVVRDKDNLPPFGNLSPTTVNWSDVSDEDEMPDLERLFDVGGTLQLKVDGATRLQVVFSEIMWAVDEGNVDDRAMYLGEQWIELHNRTSGDNAKDFALSGIKISSKEGRPALSEETDRVSNLVEGGKDWILGKGQNGNSGSTDDQGNVTGLKEFISMFRNNEGEPGHQDNRWTKSSELYASNHRGTPGEKERGGVAVIGTTNANRGPVIFNEISNHDNAAYEWIELHNVSTGTVNLKDYEVTIATTKGADQDSHNDVDFIDFSTDDLNLEADGILLVVSTDPSGNSSHPLAAGWNVDKDANSQRNGVNASSPRYVVAPFGTAKMADGTDQAESGLPDNGEFVLILRNRHDRNGSTDDDNIRDIAGFVTGDALKVDNASLFTNLWPLKNFGAANRSNNKLAAGTVQRRQYADIDGTGTKDANQNDKTAFRDDDNGWTGIGYKRNAAANVQNGGTPGYAHGTLQGADTQAAADPVVISEIMFATGSRANTPQWIELHNTSKTVGVNITDWQVTIVNHDQDDADGTTFIGDLVKDYNITGNGKVIPPGQTFLLVAHTGADTTNLPSERVHALRSKRGELIFSQYGFEITLKTKEKDGSRITVDMAGNLATVRDGAGRVGNNRQSFEDPAWMLPMGENEDGDRVSIVRVAASGASINGQLEKAWNTFDMSAHVSGRESTYYGHRTDLSSPGYTIGGVLPVSLSKFRPERLKDTGEIVVRWVTQSELNNAGFNILRSEKRDGEFTKVHFEAGQGTTSERTAYEWRDKSAKPNVVYYYQIQDVSLDGDVTTLRITHLRGNVTAAGKLTTTWGEIKALQ